jgi:hypothetical protein
MKPWAAAIIVPLMIPGSFLGCFGLVTWLIYLGG